jgi:hypothetical protein
MSSKYEKIMFYWWTHLGLINNRIFSVSNHAWYISYSNKNWRRLWDLRLLQVFRRSNFDRFTPFSLKTIRAFYMNTEFVELCNDMTKRVIFFAIGRVCRQPARSRTPCKLHVAIPDRAAPSRRWGFAPIHIGRHIYRRERLQKDVFRVSRWVDLVR